MFSRNEALGLSAILDGGAMRDVRGGCAVGCGMWGWDMEGLVGWPGASFVSFTCVRVKGDKTRAISLGWRYLGVEEKRGGDCALC